MTKIKTETSYDEYNLTNPTQKHNLPTQPKLVPNPTQRCYAPDKIYNRTSQTSIYKDVYIYLFLPTFWCVGNICMCDLVVLTPTFLPGSRVDDFYCCSSSSTGRRTKDGSLGLADYKTSGLTVWRGRTDISIWGRRSRGLRRWRRVHDRTGVEY
jgi:hypothetical protein